MEPNLAFNLYVVKNDLEFLILLYSLPCFLDYIHALPHPVYTVLVIQSRDFHMLGKRSTKQAPYSEAEFLCLSISVTAGKS